MAQKTIQNIGNDADSSLNSNGTSSFDPNKIVKVYEKMLELSRKNNEEVNDTLLTNQALAESLLKLEKEKKAISDEEQQKQLLLSTKIYKLEQDRLKLQADNPDGKNDKKIKALEKEVKQAAKDKDIATRTSARKQKEAEEAAKKAEQDARNKDILANGVSFDNGLKGAASDLGNILKVNIGDKITKLTEGKSGLAGLAQGIGNLASGMANFTTQLKGTIEEVAGYKSNWDTRLYGSGKGHSSVTDMVKSVVGASPFVKQSEYMKKVDEAIEKGIAYNIEQRAFLQTVSDDIAGTFDAFDSTLLNIVRVQQSDSTAARLGLEATLNEYLNKNYQNTEYLSNVSDTVTGALYQATSLLSSTDSIGFEYQVQKWLGSLYSVGMSSESVGGIADAIGKLASGDLSGMDSGTGKLITMSAARNGLDYASMLTDGLDASEVNTLMKSMVEYLQQIAYSSEGNNVVQSQYAQLYGLSVSDLVSAKNLGNTISGIANTGMTSNGKGYNYASAIAKLQEMGGSIASRMSMGEMLTNSLDNLKYTMASGIASSPGLYATFQMSNMLDDLVGGIAIPAISVFGNMVDLHTSVADLMKVGALSGSILSGVGSLIGSLGSINQGLNWSFDKLGVSSTATTVTRGTGYTGNSGITTSQSSYIGNSNGDDVQNNSLAQADDQKSQLAVEAADESTDVTINTVNDNLVMIYELFRDVITGNSSLYVKMSTMLSGTGWE